MKPNKSSIDLEAEFAPCSMSYEDAEVWISVALSRRVLMSHLGRDYIARTLSDQYILIATRRRLLQEYVNTILEPDTCFRLDAIHLLGYSLQSDGYFRNNFIWELDVRRAELKDLM